MLQSEVEIENLREVINGGGNTIKAGRLIMNVNNSGSINKTGPAIYTCVIISFKILY